MYGVKCMELFPEADTLDELGRQLCGCTACELRAECIAPVGWYGNPDSPLVIVGEGPGMVEDQHGCPLIGPSGQLLNKALASLGVTRDRVLTTNTIKCRPKNNKTPNIVSAAFCADRWLEKELAIINPAVVVALGSVAMHYLDHPDKRITKDRGRWFTTKGGIPAITTYHPAYLLRLSGDSLKQSKWEVYYDLKAALEKCQAERPGYVFASDPPPDLFEIFPKRR